MDFFNTFIQMLDSTIRLSVPLLLACLAGLYSERAGVFDIGLEGKMLAGAFAGAAAAAVYRLGLARARHRRSSISVAAGAGARLRLDHPSRQPDRLRRRHQLHRRRLDHHPRPGLVPAGRAHAVAAGAARFEAITLPGAEAVRDVPVLGPIYSELLSGHSILVYVAFLVVPFTWWVLFRTRFGLRLRAVGENPAAVDTAGISVTWLRYRAVICTGILSGIAGAYLSIAQNAGFVKDMTAGKGYIALAALIFAKWKPVPAMFACLLFGFLDALSIRLQGTAAAAHRPGAGAVHPGAALYPDRHPARRLHRQGDPAARRRRALREGAVSYRSAEVVMTMSHDLFEAARRRWRKAHAPYSKFPVGAAIRTDGRPGLLPAPTSRSRPIRKAGAPRPRRSATTSWAAAARSPRSR